MAENIVNLKLKQPRLVGGQVLPAGSVFQASGRLAEEYLRSGAAIPVQVAPKVERAAVQPVTERAVANRQK